MRWWKKRIEASEDLRLSENAAKVRCVIRNVRERECCNRGGFSGGRD